MTDNTGAADIHFTPAELQELNAAMAGVQVQGARQPEAVQRFSDVEAPATT